MDRYEKLDSRIYGVDLFQGKITPTKGHHSNFYYIVEHTDDYDFIKEEALKMLTAFGHTWYYFCGKHQNKWHIEFDYADVLVYGDSEEISCTISFDSLEEMADEIRYHMNERSIIPCDLYIIYDDLELYNKLKSILGFTK